jgi:NAD(P)-dependent dehydrogenase (short-subunit alcohol dehydrogenase family)
MSGSRDTIRDQYKTLPIVPTTQDCVGRTYIVTGENTGLGFKCAKHLVRLSAERVILAVRSLSKGDSAKAKIEAERGRKDVAEVWALDLSSFESIKQFGDKVKKLDRVDAMIENAGVALDIWSTAEGLETTLTVNVFSTLLLPAIVLPKLQESAKKFGSAPVLVFVGSGTAFYAKGEFEKIEGDIIESLNKGIMGSNRSVTKLYLGNQWTTLTLFEGIKFPS